MRARALLLIAACSTAPLLAGCGAATPSSAKAPLGKDLVVYSSLPLAGATEAAASEIVAGERLALAAVHHRVGRFRIGLISLNDAGPKGVWEPGLTAKNASTATGNEKTIAYIGDYNSGASAVSLPLTNQAGIPQVSPRSPYIGLTSSFYAGQGDPERFYQTGRRNFVRLLPGDAVEGAAQIALMKMLHVRKVFVLSDGQPFTAPLASILASEAKLAGIEVLGEETIEVAEAGAQPNFSTDVEKIVEAAPEAVFFSGEDDPGAVALWRELHEADPSLLLLASSDMAESAFPSEIDSGAARRTYLTSPVLPPSSYRKSAQQVLSEYRSSASARAGAGGGAGAAAKPSSYVLYGYEAMGLVLSAIRSAGPAGDNRAAVVEALMHIQDRSSVLGRYSVLPNGETTIARYAVDRVRHGRPVFWRELHVSGRHVP